MCHTSLIHGPWCFVFNFDFEFLRFATHLQLLMLPTHVFYFSTHSAAQVADPFNAPSAAHVADPRKFFFNALSCSSCRPSQRTLGCSSCRPMKTCMVQRTFGCSSCRPMSSWTTWTSLGPSWTILDHLWTILVNLESIFRPSWDQLGTILDHLGPPYKLSQS